MTGPACPSHRLPSQKSCSSGAARPASSRSTGRRRSMPSRMRMVLALRAQLDRWADDPAITRVVIMAAGGRAFCAGGDIRHLYDLGKAGQPRRGAAVLARRISAQRRHQELPQALCRADRRHRHGRRRRRLGARLAPRGRRPLFLRHAGSRHRLLPRCRRHLVAAAPGRANSAPIARLPASASGRPMRSAPGLPPTAFPRRAFPALLDGLTGTVSVDAVLAAFSEPAGEGPILARRAAIDRLFAGGRVEDILAALDSEAAAGGADAEWAAKTAATMRTKSPLSLKIGAGANAARQAWDFAECMRAEFRIVSRVIEGHDFYEGVRAVIVDKDNAPRWRPATLRRGERRGGRAPFRRRSARGSSRCHERALPQRAGGRHRGVAQPRAGASDGRRGRSRAAGPAGWCCSCA